MKKLIILIIAVSFAQLGFAQIILDKEISSKNGYVKNVKNCNDFIVQKSNGNIEIYNDEFDLVKTITSLQHLVEHELWFTSVNFFTNSGQYEFIFDNQGDYSLYNENGDLLFSFGEFGPAELYGEETNILPNSKKFICTSENNDRFRIYNVAGGTSNLVNTKANETKAYPNPANGKITIPYKLEGSQLQSMTITNVDGKVVDTILLDPNQESYTLNISNYASGVYIYNYNKYSGKFIVR